MAAATASTPKGLHGSLSFDQEEPVLISEQFRLDTEHEIPPRSFSFPTSKLSDSNTSSPLPNPHFVFPARLESSSTPSSISRVPGRRPRSAYEMQSGTSGFGRDFQLGTARSHPPSLPSFTFHPSDTASIDSGMSSPPMTPQTPSSRNVPTRSSGHRRGASEYIGGDGASGPSELKSTSPNKSGIDGEKLPTSNTQPTLAPSTGRRGHAHRRSAAMSCHDLNMILKPMNPSTPNFGGSAPTSPSDLEHIHPPFPGLMNTTQEDSLNLFAGADGSSISPPESPKARLTRARVGFSDTLEFIPRPVSIVSSDTSSTLTMRQGHSVSGSLSSLMSLGAYSPPGKEVREFPNPFFGNRYEDSQPSSPGFMLGISAKADDCEQQHVLPQRNISTAPLAKDEEDAPDSPLTPRSTSKKFLFFGHDTSDPGEASPIASLPASSPASDRPHSASNQSAPASPDQLSPNSPVPPLDRVAEQTRKPSVNRKSSKKQKKVRTWAGSILTRKGRPRSQKQKALSRRSPTPSMRAYSPETDSSHDYDLAAVEPFVGSGLPSVPERQSLQTDIASWKPRQVVSQDDDAMSPMIDLDAALGPFNTPYGFDLEWAASQNGTGSKKRPMHSAAGMKGFTGPGMHYHRRTESAPEMAVFDNPRLRLHHISNNLTMEDVFEEDEEDDWEEVKTVSRKDSTAQVADDEPSRPEPEINPLHEIADLENSMDWTASHSSMMQRGLKRKSSGLSDEGQRPTSSSVKSEKSVCSVLDEHPGDRPTTSEMANDSVISRPQSSSKSSLSSFMGHSRHQPAKELAQVEIHSTAQQPLYLTPTSQHSAFPSPFPSPRSPMSYETQKISTGPSSFTDDPAFHSLWLGEPGPELRMSVDDVPSLTSSNSTMTRESFSNPSTANSQFRNSQRPVSLQGPTVARKRSSIASLSRLLTSSHGEKSKLSIEDRPPGSPEKKESRGRRLSRMIQFWRSKEPSPN